MHLSCEGKTSVGFVEYTQQSLKLPSFIFTGCFNICSMKKSVYFCLKQANADLCTWVVRASESYLEEAGFIIQLAGWEVSIILSYAVQTNALTVLNNRAQQREKFHYSVHHLLSETYVVSEPPDEESRDWFIMRWVRARQRKLGSQICTYVTPSRPTLMKRAET